MGARGPKSAASLAVVPVAISQAKPEPPADLTEAQAVEWRAVVMRLPPDWFPRETHGLLTQYCRHVTRARMVAGLVDSFLPEWTTDPDGLPRLDKLLSMGARESKALAELAVKLRLSNQSRYTPHRAGTEAAKPGGRQPWERLA
jgi:hypothetical protein